MSEMVERVARALYECPGSDMLCKTDGGFPAPPWERAYPGIQDDCRVKARAAIAAMREPTEAIVDAYYDLCDPVGGDLRGDYKADDIYRAMIDAALKD